MQLNQLISFSEDQERGQWRALPDPTTGGATGLLFLVVGPDSATAARAAAAMVDELAEMAGADGRVSGAARAECRRRFLARHVKAWEALEDGMKVPFSFEECLRVLRASQWVQAWIDTWAGDRKGWV